MTLDEAIQHCEEQVELLEESAEGCDLYDPVEKQIACKSGECAAEHRQLAEWLKELKQLREQTRWISVSERLPKAGEYIGDVAKHYLVQNEYGDMLVARYTHSRYWEQIYQLKPYTDEIVAWMPLPEKYEPKESKEKWINIAEDLMPIIDGDESEE